ncbi:H/ACA ribonucleoprotein complex subunit 2-like protein [Agrilus planipennis]|uniref:H/ACA snoRNP protein NHP2 n=1 Tax=Agrilus planipennis TaxID=224129 RepID=A0A1W4XP98_AGRPL|nr:H/ACA ribonucleoprotein complex subunit 2-like protein [Agrilus planipennis]XP_025832043.1 H/ACA ribonucleoprotein complex subunit 2-like protein [Agrilus planipennis]
MGKIKHNEVAGDIDADINNLTVQTEDTELSYEEKLKYVNVIAKPMASKKLAKKIFKLIKKALKHKTYIRNGLKDVQSRIRRGERGLVIFAGDVSPVEIMIHIPGVCEDKEIPYCYVPSRYDLGNALGTKRGCLMVLIREKDDYKDAFDECKSEIKNLALQLE